MNKTILTMIAAFFFGAAGLPICLVFYPAMFDASKKVWGYGGMVAFWIAFFIGLFVFELLVRFLWGMKNESK